MLLPQIYIQINKNMPKFLHSHIKLQQLESRLNKNIYLSNDCLPDAADAQVFKVLQSLNRVPKRSLYPNFYHWYIMMRQFAERTLDIWIEKGPNFEVSDPLISQVIATIKQLELSKTLLKQQNPSKPKEKPICTLKQSKLENPKLDTKNTQFSKSSSKKVKEFIGPQYNSAIVKKSQTCQITVVEYIMDIRLNPQKEGAYEKIKEVFEQKEVKLSCIKEIRKSERQSNENSDLRVIFLSEPSICQQLKNEILSYQVVEMIECKKYKRNSSL